MAVLDEDVRYGACGPLPTTGNPARLTITHWNDKRVGWLQHEQSRGERARCGHLVAAGEELWGGDCWDCMDRWEREHFNETWEAGLPVYVAPSKVARDAVDGFIDWLRGLTFRERRRVWLSQFGRTETPQ